MLGLYCFELQVLQGCLPHSKSRLHCCSRVTLGFPMMHECRLRVNTYFLLLSFAKLKSGHGEGTCRQPPDQGLVPCLTCLMRCPHLRIRVKGVPYIT